MPRFGQKSSASTTMIPVTLVPCLTAIVAEPGDHLMILNNICVGVSTASPIHQPTPPVAFPAERRGTKPGTKRGPYAKRKRKARAKARPASTPFLVENRIPLVERALRITPMNLGELQRATKIPKGQLKATIDRLDREHRLVPSGKPGTGNKRTYQLATQASIPEAPL